LSFSPTWFLLQQEGFLSQACLCNGLTALANANIGDKKGLYYSAFFELSIGLERMMKLIIILDHMAQNELAPPNSQTIEQYQHKLNALFKATYDICSARGLTSLQPFDGDSLPRVLLTFLDSFAHPGGRYANLNKLTGHRHQALADPLVEWGRIATQIFAKQATASQRKTAKRSGYIARAAFGDAAASMISDLDQTYSDVEGLFARASELETVGRHAIFALVCLIDALRNVLDEVTSNAMQVNRNFSQDVVGVPDMNEFFQFAWADKNYVMRKRRWP
jgi:hypothetical protein